MKEECKKFTFASVADSDLIQWLRRFVLMDESNGVDATGCVIPLGRTLSLTMQGEPTERTEVRAGCQIDSGK